MSTVIFVAIAIGLIVGSFLGYLSAKTLAFKFSKPSPSPRIVLACSSVGALVMLLPAFFLSFVIGGNLGGSWAEALTSALGLGSSGVPYGLALGVAVLLAGGLAVGSLIGALFGKVLANVLPH